jgi:hypothetical protein
MGASPSMGTSTIIGWVISHKYNTPMSNLGFEPGWLGSTTRNLTNWAGLSLNYWKLQKNHRFKLMNLSYIRRLIDKPTDEYTDDERKVIYSSVRMNISYVRWWCGTDEYNGLCLSVPHHWQTYPQVEVVVGPWPHDPYVCRLTDEPMRPGGGVAAAVWPIGSSVNRWN